MKLQRQAWFILNDLCEANDLKSGQIGDWKLLILFSFGFVCLFVCFEGKE